MKRPDIEGLRAQVARYVNCESEYRPGCGQVSELCDWVEYQDKLLEIQTNTAADWMAAEVEGRSELTSLRADVERLTAERDRLLTRVGELEAMASTLALQWRRGGNGSEYVRCNSQNPQRGSQNFQVLERIQMLHAGHWPKTQGPLSYLRVERDEARDEVARLTQERDKANDEIEAWACESHPWSDANGDPLCDLEKVRRLTDDAIDAGGEAESAYREEEERLTKEVAQRKLDLKRVAAGLTGERNEARDECTRLREALAERDASAGEALIAMYRGDLADLRKALAESADEHEHQAARFEEEHGHDRCHAANLARKARALLTTTSGSEATPPTTETE